MNRDELLTKLAMELKEWPSVVTIKKHHDGWDWANGDFYPHLISHDKKHFITRNNWLARRLELINEPEGALAPEWSLCVAQISSGEWRAYSKLPERADDEEWVFDTLADLKRETICLGTIPDGHRWQDTLKRVERNACSDAIECGKYANGERYCDDCPNRLDEANRRMSDQRLAGDMGKQARYQDLQGDDWIDEFARTATLDEFRGAMRFTIGKYNRRVGKKDDVLQEVRKMKDYCARWEAYELALKS